MKAFVVTMALVCALEILGALYILVTRDIPARTPTTFAINAVLNFAVVLWAVYALRGA